MVISLTRSCLFFNYYQYLDAEYYHRQQRADQQPQNYYYGSSHAGHYQDVSDNEENISTTSVSPPPAPTPSDRKYDKVNTHIHNIQSIHIYIIVHG